MEIGGKAEKRQGGGEGWCVNNIVWNSVVSIFFFFNDTATTEIYTLSLHDALPIYPGHGRSGRGLDLDSPDAFSISEDQTTLTLEILRTGKVFDQVRVIVGQPIPGPGGAALLGAVAVFGSRRRR